LAYDSHEECTLLPDGSAFGICTNSARYLQSILGGVVAGYGHAENPTAEIGASEFGHDFLVLEQYIVDIWASEGCGTPPVIKISNAQLVKKLYGDPSKWRVWRCGMFEKFLGKPISERKRTTVQFRPASEHNCAILLSS